MLTMLNSQMNDSKHRVCHIATMTNRGGVEQLLIDYLTDNQPNTIQHFLLATSSNPDVMAPIKDAKVPIFQPRRSFHYDPSAIYQMVSWLRLQQIQIVHSYNAYANAWGNIAALMARIPIFISGEHGTAWWARPPMSWLDRWAHHRALVIIANSNASATMLCRKYRVSANKIRVIYNAIPDLPTADTARIRAGFGIGSGLLIGSVGRLDTPKDFFTFINAASLVLQTRRNGVYFMIVGGGPLETELREYIADLGIQDRFIMTGWRMDARAIVQSFDIFVSTSVRETFGNALVEASLASKPVIAPCIDGIPEAVLDRITGILLYPTETVKCPQSLHATPLSKMSLVNGKLQTPKALNPRELAETILILVDHPELSKEYGLAGKRRAETMFSIEKYKHELEKIYFGLMG